MLIEIKNVGALCNKVEGGLGILMHSVNSILTHFTNDELTVGQPNQFLNFINEVDESQVFLQLYSIRDNIRVLAGVSLPPDDVDVEAGVVVGWEGDWKTVEVLKSVGFVLTLQARHLCCLLTHK